MDKELEERIDSDDFQKRLEKWKQYSRIGIDVGFPGMKVIKEEESLVKKYQDMFEECIRKRDLALHKSLHDKNRIDYERYNAEAFVLIGVIEDFRKLEGKETLDIDAHYPTNPLNTVKIINVEEDIPMDEDGFFRT